MTFNITKCLFFCSKTMEYQYFDVCCHDTCSCASKPLLLRCNLVIPQCMCQVSLRLKEVQMGTHDFKYNNVPIFARKLGNINTSMSAAPKLALVPASRCILVIPQCMCQVSLRLKEVQMGTHDLKYNKVPLFGAESSWTEILSGQKFCLEVFLQILCFLICLSTYEL